MTIKKTALLMVLNLIAHFLFAQTSVDDGLIELGKSYRQFMLRNSPPESVLNDFKKYDNTALAFTADFIKETLTKDNQLISDKFLTRPGDRDLKYIYIVERINYNVRKDNPEDNQLLIKELNNKNITSNELLDAYYSMLFNGYGNKVKPFDLSTVNFELNRYHLKNDTEKGIFFLQSMRFNGSEIWGYMHIPKPPRYDEALNFINRYPKYNGSPYYQYLDLSFPDFKINIGSEDTTQSYKEYYIDKYYDILLSHLICLIKLNKSKDEIYDLTLGSILKEKNYYKYSKKESELNELLKEIKNNGN